MCISVISVITIYIPTRAYTPPLRTPGGISVITPTPYYLVMTLMTLIHTFSCTGVYKNLSYSLRTIT